MAVGGFDQPFDLGAVQTLHRSAALAWSFQTELAACLFDHMLGLVVGQVMLPPKLGRLSSDIAQGVRFMVLTANLTAPGSGFAARHDSGYAKKFGVCSFCEQPFRATILNI